MKNRVHDLAERTAKFGERAIEFCPQLTFTPVTTPLITQFVKASTSIGANYCEAVEGESTADFRHKIGIFRKESRETNQWCRMLATAVPAEKTMFRTRWTEARELRLIFCKIIRTTDINIRAAKLSTSL